MIRAFSAEHASKVTGLSLRQLSYWDRTGFFSPSYAFENRRTPYSRIYSFRDVVGLRAISVLRKQHGIPLQQLREVAERLSRRKGTAWSDLVLYVFRNEVHFGEPETGRVRRALSGQYISIPLRNIIDDAAERSTKLRERASHQVGRVERRRHIAHNAWVVAGTRIPVQSIRRLRDAGYSFKGIIREYPLLTEDDITSALELTERLTKAA